MRLKRFSPLSIHRDEAGAAIIIWALLTPLIAGFAALAVDTGVWYTNRNKLQTAADAAAVAAAYQISATATQSSLQAIAQSEGTRNGLGAAQNVTITASYPPSSGSYSGNMQTVSVTFSMLQQRFLSALALNSSPTINVTATARQQNNGGACVLALDGFAMSTLDFSGSPSVTLNNCSVASNSNNVSAIDLSGSASLTAAGLYTVGGYSVSGSATLVTTTTPVTNANPITDPYASLSDPSFSGCDQNNYTAQNTVTLNPGVYCGGLRVNANANVTLNPGTYYIDRDEFRVNGGATINGTGVTIVLTSSNGSDYATVDINGSATLNITAPTSGTYSGIAMYQDRHASTGDVNRINGNANTRINGVLYFPQQEIDFTGGATTDTTSCTQIVARLINFSGNASLANNCAANGVQNITLPMTVQLVE